ncbi:MAG: tesB [Microbacteriaceae bacterium]|nr:tesB [Microbacteriaceae bacterium]
MTDGPSTDPLATAINVLNLTDTAARTSEDIFVGTSGWIPTRRVFGGQVLGQSVVAAQRTIEGRRIHSLHGYFVRPGDVGLPITFGVDRIHDGRSFATRRVQAYQNGKPIFSMIASFQTDDDGLEHQSEMPSGIPGPEELQPLEHRLATQSDNPLLAWVIHQAFEFRTVYEPAYLPHEPSDPFDAVWFKTRGAVADDPDLHTALLAYASDYNLLFPIYRKHGVAPGSVDVKPASLDHAMWFHRQARVDEWMLYVAESPNATGGRGLALGRIYSRDGVLLASVAQEGTIRVGPFPAR